MTKDIYDVAITNADYNSVDIAFAQIIESLELAALTKNLNGKKIFIKPNMLGLFPPEKHATTHPSLVKAAVSYFKQRGAIITVGDNCGVSGYGLNEKVARRTGIFEASQGYYKNIAQHTQKADLNSEFKKSVPISSDMLEADYLISLPKMKTHSLTIVTGGVKNMFGIIAGIGKGQSHTAAPGSEDFGKILSQIFSLRPPDLTIMDGITAMEGNGPSGGKPKDVGVLMGSKNAVALDTVMCRIMGVDPKTVHHLKLVHELGLGPVDINLINIIGSLPEPGHFKLPQTISRFNILSRVVNKGFFRRIARTKLALNTKKCKKCKICYEECPADAMQWSDEYPLIKEELCIRCLCCHELCPYTAWEFKGFMQIIYNHLKKT